ncbi:MAG: hypothetical protein ACUVX8_04340 [Candidatus Zipacnadales bacterium]
MGVVGKTTHDLMEEKARQSVASLIERVRKETLERAHQVQLPPYAREAINRIDRSYFQGRKLKLFGPPRFHPEMQVFLPIMLLRDACDHRRLRDKLESYARYLAENYRYVWCRSPVSLPMRLQARDLLLREGESEFGETPLAAAMAFVRYHFEMTNLTSLTDFGLLYNRAYILTQENYFANLDVEGTAHWESFKDHPEREVKPVTPENPKAALQT